MLKNDKGSSCSFRNGCLHLPMLGSHNSFASIPSLVSVGKRQEEGLFKGCFDLSWCSYWGALCLPFPDHT